MDDIDSKKSLCPESAMSVLERNGILYVKYDRKPVRVNTFVFMKVGSHGDESYQQILARKNSEEQRYGFMLWGYSGTLLNPKSLVHGLESNYREGEKPLLLMSETKSPFRNNPVESLHVSTDKILWHPLPKGLGTKGCDKALICRGLRPIDVDINFSNYAVATGPSKGRPLSEYVRHRTDKACATYDGSSPNVKAKIIKVTWLAELLPPFAVYLSSDIRRQKSLFHGQRYRELGVIRHILPSHEPL